MLKNAFQEIDTDFPTRYHFDGYLFNLRRLQAETKVQTNVLDELLYADDMDKNASSESKMQRAMDQVSHVITMISQSGQKRLRLYTTRYRIIDQLSL